MEYLKDRARLFSVMMSNRTRDNGHRLKHKKFCLNTVSARKHYFTVRVAEHWHRLPRLPREVVECPSLEIFKSYLVKILGNSFQMALIV